MNLLNLLRNLINEHGSSQILRERLSLAADEAKKLEKEYRELEAENEKLKQENTELRQQLEAATIPDEFVEARGVLFRRLSNGEIDKDAYCPTCKTVMFSLHGVLPLKCSKCEFVAAFTGNEIPNIAKTIA